MKKLGIIGGAGPLASALLYETVVRECYYQKLPLPEIFLLSYPFTRGLTYEEGVDKQTRIERELQHAIEILEKNRVELALLACNTLHIYLRRPVIPFFSLPEATLQEALKEGKRRLLILGTQNTRRHQLYAGGELLPHYPNCREQRLIDRVIDQVLEGEIRKQDAVDLSSYIASFADRVEGVVLGCTDLSVLHHHFPIVSEIPIYDSIKIPAKNILQGLL